MLENLSDTIVNKVRDVSIAKKVFEVSKEEKMSHEKRASMSSYTTVACAQDPFLESYGPLLSFP